MSKQPIIAQQLLALPGEALRPWITRSISKGIREHLEDELGFNLPEDLWQDAIPKRTLTLLVDSLMDAARKRDQRKFQGKEHGRNAASSGKDPDAVNRLSVLIEQLKSDKSVRYDSEYPNVLYALLKFAEYLGIPIDEDTKLDIAQMYPGAPFQTGDWVRKKGQQKPEGRVVQIGDRVEPFKGKYPAALVRTETGDWWYRQDAIELDSKAAPLTPKEIVNALKQFARAYDKAHEIGGGSYSPPSSVRIDQNLGRNVVMMDPYARQQLDNYGNEGAGYDEEGWREDYKTPLLKEAQEFFALYYPDIAHRVYFEVNEKGFLFVAPSRAIAAVINPLDQMPGGLADERKPADFDPGALTQGTQVEMEHTDDPAVAREIAMDHLTEDPAYYDKLKLIEAAARAPLQSEIEKDGEDNIITAAGPRKTALQWLSESVFPGFLAGLVGRWLLTKLFDLLQSKKLLPNKFIKWLRKPLGLEDFNATSGEIYPKIHAALIQIDESLIQKTLVEAVANLGANHPSTLAAQRYCAAAIGRWVRIPDDVMIEATISTPQLRTAAAKSAVRSPLSIKKYPRGIADGARGLWDEVIRDYQSEIRALGKGDTLREWATSILIFQNIASERQTEPWKIGISPLSPTEGEHPKIRNRIVKRLHQADDRATKRVNGIEEKLSTLGISIPDEFAMVEPRYVAGKDEYQIVFRSDISISGVSPKTRAIIKAQLQKSGFAGSGVLTYQGKWYRITAVFKKESIHLDIVHPITVTDAMTLTGQRNRDKLLPKLIQIARKWHQTEAIPHA